MTDVRQVRGGVCHDIAASRLKKKNHFLLSSKVHHAPRLLHKYVARTKYSLPLQCGHALFLGFLVECFAARLLRLCISVLLIESCTRVFSKIWATLCPAVDAQQWGKGGCVKFNSCLTYSRQCPDEQMPPSAAGSWWSLSPMKSGMQERKKLGV